MKIIQHRHDINLWDIVVRVESKYFLQDHLGKDSNVGQASHTISMWASINRVEDNDKARESKLKLHSLFAAWLCWTFHTKSHYMKAYILSHSWSPFLPCICLYWKNELLWVSVSPSRVFSWEKTLLRLPMQITWPWPPVGIFSHILITVRQKKNVNITLLDLCLFTFYSVLHTNEFTWHWL